MKLKVDFVLIFSQYYKYSFHNTIKMYYDNFKVSLNSTT